MITHTPGPWRYVYADGYCGEIIASNGKSVCTFTDEPNESDAHLMEAAPDLLEVLMEITETLGRPDTFAKARAAISKARGENP